MSEQAPEAPPRASSGGGGGNVFKRKIGPLPMWVWLAILGALIVAYALYRRSKSAASSAAAGTSTATAAGSTPASDIPQFVNQTYTTVTPPNAPAPAPAPVSTATGTARPTQITASGADSGDLNQIAGRYGITEQALIAANPGLRKVRVHPANSKTKLVALIGSGLPVPSGTVLKIPPIAAKS